MKWSELSSLPLRRAENTLLQLRSEMHLVIEGRCETHGTDGDTANASAGLLPFIGVEIIAQRTKNGETKDQSIRRVFAEIATMTSFAPYAAVGFSLFKLTRNGLAHGFFPNDAQLPNGPIGGINLSFEATVGKPRTVCVKRIGTRSDSHHLSHQRVGSERVVIQVSAQHLYLDLAAYIDAFRARLATDAALQQLAEQNDERLLLSSREAATDGLESGDTIALGL